MRVLKISELGEKPMDTATPIAGWTGGPVSRTRQAVIGDGQSENFRCNVVNFRGFPHIPGSDYVLRHPRNGDVLDGRPVVK